MFDLLQKVIEALTGRKMGFKGLCRDGTIIALNVDLEIPQIMGAADSFLASNEPDHSGVTAGSSEALIPLFIRGCLVHSRRYGKVDLVLIICLLAMHRAVREFKGKVDDGVYNRLLGFYSLPSMEALDAYTEWACSLNVPEITSE